MGLTVADLNGFNEPDSNRITVKENALTAALAVGACRYRYSDCSGRSNHMARHHWTTRLAVIMLSAMMLISGSGLSVLAYSAGAGTDAVASQEDQTQQGTATEGTDVSADQKSGAGAEQAGAGGRSGQAADADKAGAGGRSDKAADADKTGADTDDVDQAGTDTDASGADTDAADAAAADTDEADQPDVLADTENAADWEATLSGSLPEDIREAVVEVAKSQIGYKESVRNYKENKDGSRSSYTRYGAFAGDEYADPWDADFAMFALHYAGVLDIDKTDIPLDGDTAKWIKSLRKAELMSEITDESKPEPGDVVFVGKSTDLSSAQTAIAIADDDGRIGIIGIEEKDGRDQVSRQSVSASSIIGYVSLKALVPAKFTAQDLGEAEQAVTDIAEDAASADAEADDADKAEDPETADEAAEAEASDAADGIVLADQSIDAKLVAAPGIGGKLRSLFTSNKNTKITLTGKLPEDAYIKAYPVNVEIEGQNVLAAYDITIYIKDAEGKEVVWQPDEPVSVSITNDIIAESEGSANIYHMEDANSDAELVSETSFADGEVTFDAGEFSVYAVTKAILTTTITTPEGLDYWISVTYDSESGLPMEEDGATLDVEVKDSASYQKKVAKATGNESINPIKAFDISIVDANGKKYQPTKSVTVSIELSGKSSYSNPQVVHIPDGVLSSPEAITPDVESNTLTFSTNGFSIYVVADEEDMETYIFQCADGSIYDRQSIAAGDVLVKPTTPVIEGKIFEGWYLVEDGNVSDNEFTGFGTIDSITKDKEYILRAKYDDRIYITYYDQEGAVMRMDNAAEAVETEGSNSGKIDPDKVTYTPVDKNGVSYDFLGWAETQGANESAKVDPFVPTENKSLYPILAAGQWINYHSNAIGSGATYTEPSFVRASAQPTAPVNPTREGFTFKGWWTSADDSGAEVFNDSGTLTNNAYRRLTAPLDLYAHWEGETVTYTVAYWTQLASDEADLDDSDKNYAFQSAETVSAKAGDDVTITFDASYKSVAKVYPDTSSNDYKGFKYNQTLTEAQLTDKNGNPVTVNGDGTTTINVYFDRKTFTLHFMNFALENQSHQGVRITAPNGYTDADDFLQRANYSSNWRTITGGTAADDALWLRGESTDDRYALSIRALYDHPISSYFPVAAAYRESSGGAWSTVNTCSWWNADNSNTPAISGLFKYLGNMPLVKGGEDNGEEYLIHNRFTPSMTPAKITYYTETVEGEEGDVEYQGKQYKLYTETFHNYAVGGMTIGARFPNNMVGFSRGYATPNFYLDSSLTGPNRFDGKNVFYAGDNATASMDDSAKPYAKWSERNNSTVRAWTDNSNYYLFQDLDVKFYYNRLSYNLILKNAQTDATIDTISKQFEAEVTDESLQEIAETLTPPTGHRFKGWYIDRDCNVPAFENGSIQMPADSLTLYAGFEPIYYQITLDPKGGELPSGASTWFWRAYDATFSEYAPRRDYVQTDTGDYTYVMYKPDPDDINDESDRAQNTRTAKYYQAGEVPNVPDWEIEAGITIKESGYDRENNAYTFVGWFKEKADGTLESTSYNFNQPVRGDIHLVAKWQPNIVYSVSYALKDENGEDRDDLGGVLAPLDDTAYAGESRAQVKDLENLDKLTYGMRFRGWKILGDDSGTVYSPNESFVISEDYAERTYDPATQSYTRQITLIPVVDDAPPAHQTSGLYIFMNRVWKYDTDDGNGICYRDEEGQKIDNDKVITKDVSGEETYWVTFYEEIVYSGESLTEPPATPENCDPDADSNSEFQGWYEDASLITRFDGFGEIKTPEPVKTLYASFAKPIRVYYYTAVDNAHESDRKLLNVQSYQSNGEGYLDTTGVGTSYIYNSIYNLCGWSETKLPLGVTEQENVTVYPYNASTRNTSVAKQVSEDMTLYPVMESGHTLSFDTLGGEPIPSRFYGNNDTTVAPPDPVKGDYDSSRPAAERNEYTFDGWYTDTTYTTPFTFGSTLNESVMIYAKWINNWEPDQAKVTTVYWLQNSDGTTYSVAENREASLTPRDNYTLTESERSGIISTLLGSNAAYYELDHMDLSDSNGNRVQNSGDAIIKADIDNTATINVYYKLKRYNLTFDPTAGGTITPPSEGEGTKWTYDSETRKYTILGAYLGMSLSGIWPDASSVTPPSGKVFSKWEMGGNYYNGNDTVSTDMLGDGTTSTLNYTADYINKDTPTNVGDNHGELDVLNGASDPTGSYFEVVVNHHLRNTADGTDVDVIQKRQVVNFTNYKRLIATTTAGETDRANLKDTAVFPNSTYDHLVQQTSNGNKTFTDTTTTNPYTLYSYTKKYAFFARRSALLPLVYNYSGENAYTLESNPNKTRGVFRILSGTAEISDSTWVYMNTDAGGIGAILSDTYPRSNDVSATYSTIKADYLTYLNESTQSGTTYFPGVVTVDIVYVRPAPAQHTLTLMLSTTDGEEIKPKLSQNFSEGASISEALAATLEPAEKSLMIPEGTSENDYTFMGWSLYPDHYVPYAETTMPNSDLTLYSYVAPRQVSVTTRVKENTEETRTREVNTQFGSFDIPTPRTDEDEVFLGWRDESTGEYWDYNMPVKEDTVVRAMFRKGDDAFFVHYDLGDGTVVSTPPITGTEADADSSTYFDSQSGDVTVSGENKRWKDSTGYAPGAKIPAPSFEANPNGNDAEDGSATATVRSPSGYNQFIYWKDARGKTYRVNDMIAIPLDGDITLYAVYSRWLETTLRYEVNAGNYVHKDVVFKDYRDPDRADGELYTNQTYPVGNSYDNGYSLLLWDMDNDGQNEAGIELLNPGYTFRGWLDFTRQGEYNEALDGDKDSILYQNNTKIRVNAPDLDNDGNPIVNRLIAQWKQDKLPVKAIKDPVSGSPSEITGSAGDMTTDELSSWTASTLESAYKSSKNYTVDDGYKFSKAMVGSTEVTDIRYAEKLDETLGYEWQYKAKGETSYTTFAANDTLELHYALLKDLTVINTIEGQYADMTRPFAITVTLTKSDPNASINTTELPTAAATIISGAAGATQTPAFSVDQGGKSASMTANLGNGDRVVITGIPAGWKYTITEGEHSGYILTSKTGSGNFVDILPEAVSLTADTSVTLKNKFDDGSVVPSGIAGHGSPLMLIILLLAAGEAAIFVIRRRRRRA